MFSLVLATALTVSVSTPEFGWGRGCYGCYGCYGGGIAVKGSLSVGWCHGCYGGCAGCYGGCAGCFGGCAGWACHGCGGGWACHGCGGGWSCHGCCGGWSCHGCSGMGYGYCTGCCGGTVYYSACTGCCGGVIPVSPPVRVIEPDPNVPPMKKDDEKLEKGDKKGGKSLEGDEAAKKGTPLSADEAAWLKEMMDAETDAAKKKEIEEEFKGESSLGRAAIYKLFKKGSQSMAATVIVRAATDVTVSVNGVRLTRKTVSDTFLTPELPQGKPFSYVVTATATRGGRQVTETKRIGVRAGATAQVDFTDIGSQPVRADVAEVTVVAPRNTAVRVNGSTFTINGRKTFETPALKVGQPYYYTVEAELDRDGRQVTETRRVSVEPGKAVTVDFTVRETVAAR